MRIKMHFFKNIGLIAEVFKVALQKENNKKVNFSPFLVTSCMWAYKKNPALYSQFRSMLGGLPCITTLKSYSNRVALEQGVNMGLISNAYDRYFRIVIRCMFIVLM